MKYLVTGANRGIGLEFCKQLVARCDEVIAVCRKSNEELEKLEVTVIEGVDVSNFSDVQSLPGKLDDHSIDVLINNAGIMKRDGFEQDEFKSILDQFMVNSLGPLQVSMALRTKMKSPGKIGIVTSRMGSIADNTSGGAYGYRMSKSAVNAAGKSLSHDFKDEGISVVLLHPGWVKTDMTNHNGQITTQESVSGLIKILDDLNMDLSGKFFHTNGEELPW